MADKYTSYGDRLDALEQMAHPWSPDAEGDITNLRKRVGKLEKKIWKISSHWFKK